MSQVRNAYPAMRIFVFGEEVTNDVLSCSPNIADDLHAPSTAQFTLTDKPQGGEGVLSRYVMDREDIIAMFPDLDPIQLALPDYKGMIANDPTLGLAYAAARSTGVREQQIAQLQEAIGVSATGAETLLNRVESVVGEYEQEYLEAIDTAAGSYRAKVLESLAGIKDPVKQRVLRAKFDKLEKVAQPDLSGSTFSSLREAAGLTGQAFRYNFWAKRPIFHSNDPVRIFWRDPFDSRFWFYKFTGFISDWTIQTTANNVRTVTFTCEDALRPFRYARITTNPGLFDIASVQENEDFVSRTFFNNDFTKLTLTELLFLLVFGPEQTDLLDILAKQGNLAQDTLQRIRRRQQGASKLTHKRYASNGGESVQQVPAFGIGAFDFERSTVVSIGPAPNPPQASTTSPVLYEREVKVDGPGALGAYQALVDHQVYVSDLDSLLLKGEEPAVRANMVRDPETGQPRIADVITEIGSNPHRYPVDGGRLIILAPASLGPGLNRNILERDFKGVEGQTTWGNRLAIIYAALDRLEFRFYASPRGDILAEMPLYDFEPSDFGEVSADKQPIKYRGAEGGALAQFRRVLDGAETRGPYAPHYRVALRNTLDDSQTFTDEKIRTQFRTSWYILQGYTSAGVAEVIGQAPAVTTLRALVPQFGVRCEVAEPQVFISTKEAAEVYNNIKLNQWNADALTSQLDILPSMRLGPNRPVEFMEGPYIATLRSVGCVLNWEGRDMTQTVGVNYTRVWDGATNGKDTEGRKKLVYAAIGGAASRPYNYAALFKGAIFTASTKERAAPAAPVKKALPQVGQRDRRPTTPGVSGGRGGGRTPGA